MIEKFPNNNEQYHELAEQLDELQKEENEGRGVECVRWIVEDLRRGDVEAAKANYRNQSDKINNYPKIKELLKKAGIVEEIDWDSLGEF